MIKSKTEKLKEILVQRTRRVQLSLKRSKIQAILQKMKEKFNFSGTLQEYCSTWLTRIIFFKSRVRCFEIS